MTSHLTADNNIANSTIAICPILLRPIKEEARLVPCNHLVDKVAAEKKFGMIRPDGTASKPNVCPVCPTLVTGYLACANSSQLVDTSIPKETIAQSVNEVKDTSVNQSETRTFHVLHELKTNRGVCAITEIIDKKVLALAITKEHEQALTAALEKAKSQVTQQMFDQFNNLSQPSQAQFDAFNNSGPVPNQGLLIRNT